MRVKPILIMLSAALFLIAASLGVAQRRVSREDTLVDRVLPPIENSSGESTVFQCEGAMTLLYASVERYLTEAKQPTADGVKQASDVAAVANLSEVIVIPLTNRPRGDFFVGASCNTDVTNTYAGFRVFRSTGPRYEVASRSEDYALLSTAGEDGIGIDHASLEAAKISNADQTPNAVYIATVWTAGGGRPAPFSIVVWQWDSEKLEPVWNKLNVRDATVKLVSPLMLVSAAGRNNYASSNTVYRIDGSTVRSDGQLSTKLLERYLSAKVLPSGSAEELSNIAYLWEAAGNPGRAIPLYEKVLAGKHEANTYLYLTVADLYVSQGQASKAAKTLGAYRQAAKGELSASDDYAIQQRIKNLQRAAQDQ